MCSCITQTTPSPGTHSLTLDNHFQGAQSQSWVHKHLPSSTWNQDCFPKGWLKSNQTRFQNSLWHREAITFFISSREKRSFHNPQLPCHQLLPVGTLPNADWEQLLTQIHWALALLFPACCFFLPVLLGDFSKAANSSRNQGCRKTPWDFLPNPRQHSKNHPKHVILDPSKQLMGCPLIAACTKKWDTDQEWALELNTAPPWAAQASQHRTSFKMWVQSFKSSCHSC